MIKLANIILEQPLSAFAKISSDKVLTEYMFSDYFAKVARANGYSPQEVINQLYNTPIKDLQPLVKNAYDLTNVIVNSDNFVKSAFMGNLIQSAIQIGQGAWNGFNTWLDGKLHKIGPSADEIVDSATKKVQPYIDQGKELVGNFTNQFQGITSDPMGWLTNNPMLGGIIASILGLGAGGLMGGGRGAALGGSILPILAIAPYLYNKYQQQNQQPAAPATTTPTTPQAPVPQQPPAAPQPPQAPVPQQPPAAPQPPQAPKPPSTPQTPNQPQNQQKPVNNQFGPNAFKPIQPLG